ncbi:DNA replication initiation factor cdc45 [Coemansia sp. RSA 1286]|nr:DNA replication initiation factor cdc45 [Coemansia sp. RSA 1286]
MVYVASSKYEDAYNRILAGAAHSQGTSVLIFAATDGDSICALRILTDLLKRDSIGHKIVPVSNYREIADQSVKLVDSGTQIRSVVLINCGASMDIHDLINLRDTLTVVVVDSHRPFNLYNVFWNEQIQCLDDGDVADNMDELREAFELIEFGPEDSDTDDESDDDNGGDRRRRRRVGDDPDEFVRVQRERASMREAKMRSRELIQAYYAQGTYHGQASSVTMLQLAEQLGRQPTADSVWCAITGSATQLVMQHIDTKGYDLVISWIRDQVRRISTPTTTAAVRQQQPVDDDHQPDLFDPRLDLPDEDADEGYVKALAGVGTAAEAGLLSSSRAQMGPLTNIQESAELRFTLLRHWSLDNAMQYSPYVASRLATWSAKGRARLSLLLAKLGLSKAEAQAPFIHLAPDLKIQLSKRMRQIGADYSMSDASIQGFVRSYGWRKPTLSSFDMALALLALLHTDGFYSAYDALAQPDCLRHGLDQAKQQQVLIVAQGLVMLERQAVKTLKSFRLAILSDTTEQTPAGPMAMRQLALFLMNTLRERCRPAHARLPFIIAAPLAMDQPDRLLVLGVTPLDCVLHRPEMLSEKLASSRFAGTGRNHFGMVFDDVAADLGADIKQGFFDSSVLEINRADMAVFVDKLRRHL